MSKNIFDDLIAYEDGSIDDSDIVPLFQRIIDDGTVWRLQGSYGRTAQALIEDGRCILGPTGHRDYYGNYVPSRFEVKPGTKGSADYARRTQEEQH